MPRKIVKEKILAEINEFNKMIIPQKVLKYDSAQNASDARR
jgi:hypothetical protein